MLVEAADRRGGLDQVVVEDAELIAIRRESFDAILRDNPGIGRSILRELAERLKTADEKLHGE